MRYLLTISAYSTYRDVPIHTLEVLTNAQEKFVSGELNDKTEILSVIGQNPILLDGKLQITPNAWMIPVKDNVKTLNAQLAEVRTKPHKIQKDLEEAIFASWCE